MDGSIPPNTWTGTIQQKLMEGTVPDQISYLMDLLARESANLSTEYHWRIQLSRELEELEQELFRQKKQMKMFLNRGKATKQELERFQKYSDPETLSATRIASQVNNTIKRKKKKDLQKDYEELQVAYIIRQEEFNNELQVEKTKNNALQEELEMIRASYKELSQSCEADVLTARLQAVHLQQELAMQIRLREERVLQDELLMRNLRDEKDSLYLQMKEMTLVQQNGSEQETILQQGMEELQDQFGTELHGESQGDQPEEESLSNVLPEPKDKQLPEKTEKLSDAAIRKRICHFLGLGKPKRFRKSTALTTFSLSPNTSSLSL